jgi:hypothetical protein
MKRTSDLYKELNSHMTDILDSLNTENSTLGNTLSFPSYLKIN